MMETNSDYFIYQQTDENIKIDVCLEGELNENATCKDFLQV